MTTYYIYNIATDEYLGEVIAFTINGAEYKACGIFTDIPVEYIAAFTERF